MEAGRVSPSAPVPDGQAAWSGLEGWCSVWHGDHVGLISAVCFKYSSEVVESRCARLAPPLRSGLAGWSVPRSQEGGVDPESELCLCLHTGKPSESSQP